MSWLQLDPALFRIGLFIRVDYDSDRSHADALAAMAKPA